jgi:hypothetical protein
MKKRSKQDPYGKLRKCSMKQLKEFVEGCRIYHNRGSKASKAYLIELIEQCLESNELPTVFTSKDFSNVVRGVGGGKGFIKDGKARGKVNRPGLARGLGWTSRYDSWYITYSYVVGRTEYAFIWETYYDELHRAYSGEKVWYDALGDGTHFTIKYYDKDPRLHIVTAKKFLKLTEPCFVGKRKAKKRG